MAIFGTLAPRFGSVDLDNVVRQRDEPVFKRTVNQSKIDGSRLIHLRFTNWTFEVVMMLFKYANPLAKHSELDGVRGTDASLWRHRDGREFRDKAGEAIPFKLIEIAPFYLNTSTYEDALLLRFEINKISVVGLSIGDLLLPGRIITSPEGKFIVTDKGLRIKIS